jgi:hypothetical protein
MIDVMALTDDDKRWIADLLDTRLEAVETKLLTAFHGWASPVEARQRRHRDSIHDLEVDLDALTARVKALEDRPNGKA